MRQRAMLSWPGPRRVYQRQAAEDTIAAASGYWGAKVITKISEAGPFWEAEADDQYYLQRYTDGDNQFSRRVGVR